MKIRFLSGYDKFKNLMNMMILQTEKKALTNKKVTKTKTQSNNYNKI